MPLLRLADFPQSFQNLQARLGHLAQAQHAQRLLRLFARRQVVGLFCTCGGSITVFPGFTLLRLEGGNIPAFFRCFLSAYVVGTNFGWKHNVTSQITAANAPNGAPGIAHILI